ncbi:MAG TPA: hypothetical protein VGC13_04040 [Longimicrobium sp.]|jgi:hypothetical protein|uniref:hypothetical protein n=1 Tax=Longimicrobium sp. TaxID=2029185 RepID=UPI002ED97C41
MPAIRLCRLAAAGLACAALLLAVPCLNGQTTVQPGVRVRILAPATADTLLTGTVVAFDSAALLLAPESGRAGVHVPLATIRRLEVAQQRSHEAGLWGLVLGGAAGYALMSTECSGVGGCNHVRTLGLVGGAAVGMLLGNLFGGGGGDRWRTVPVFSPGPP